MSFSFVCFYVHKAAVVKLKFERYVPYVFLDKSFACSRVLTNFKLVSRGTEMHGVVSEVGVMYFCMRFFFFCHILLAYFRVSWALSKYLFFRYFPSGLAHVGQVFRKTCESV